MVADRETNTLAMVALNFAACWQQAAETKRLFVEMDDKVITLSKTSTTTQQKMFIISKHRCYKQPMFKTFIVGGFQNLKVLNFQYISFIRFRTCVSDLLHIEIK